MQLIERIEKRRFVGREFLLWLWFESEVFEGTLSTEEHGTFGLWIERQAMLSDGAEATRIKGANPTGHREAKESLLRSKLPESAGLRLARGEEESTFVLKAEALAFSGLKLPTVLGQEDEAPALAPPPPPPRKRKGGPAAAAQQEADGEHEIFYERMRLTREAEEILEALYRDFLVLRLGPAWAKWVVPALQAWAQDQDVDAEAYRTSTRRVMKRSP